MEITNKDLGKTPNVGEEKLFPNLNLHGNSVSFITYGETQV